MSNYSSAAAVESPWITIVVPTRDRIDTLRECLKTLLSQDYLSMTVLVSDNASGDGTRDWVLGQSDSRLHYVNTGRRLSMAQNYEFALAHLPDRRGWVMLLGDDDGLVPGAIRRAAQLIVQTGALALRSRNCQYSWPSMTQRSFGRLGIPNGRGWQRRSSRDWLAKVMRCEASYHELPMLYQGGVVAVSVIDEIVARSGRFYRSCIPDVYSAMAIASVVDEYVFTEEPLAINGLSRHSIGMSQGRDSFKEGSPARNFQSENDLVFHPAVPLRDDGDYPVGQAIVYEPFLQSEHLRSGRSLTTHEEQLVLALAAAEGEQRGLVLPWGRRFATLHSLDFAGAERRASKLRKRQRLRRAAAKISGAARIVTLGSPTLPLCTIHEASIAAGVVREAGGGAVLNLMRRAKGVLTQLSVSR